MGNIRWNISKYCFGTALLLAIGFSVVLLFSVADSDPARSVPLVLILSGLAANLMTELQLLGQELPKCTKGLGSGFVPTVSVKDASSFRMASAYSAVRCTDTAGSVLRKGENVADGTMVMLQN